MLCLLHCYLPYNLYILLLTFLIYVHANMYIIYYEKS